MCGTRARSEFTVAIPAGRDGLFSVVMDGIEDDASALVSLVRCGRDTKPHAGGVFAMDDLTSIDSASRIVHHAAEPGGWTTRAAGALSVPLGKNRQGREGAHLSLVTMCWAREKTLEFGAAGHAQCKIWAQKLRKSTRMLSLAGLAFAIVVTLIEL